MLPRHHRLRSAADFRSAVRRGRRAGSDTLVVHLLTHDEPRPLRAGLIVGRSVGPAVVRNRTKRQLRALLAARLPALPDTGLLVVRAQPKAGTSSSALLADHLDRLLAKAAR